jgi:DNA-binding FadR family transcriptional regulator
MSPPAARRRPRSLALDLVEALGDRIRSGRIAAGAKLPTEAAVMDDFGVSRTVVREAISKLQAAGLVQTRHGIGTFVLGLGDTRGFRIDPEHYGTLRDVIAVLELRLGVETEAAALAAKRRTSANLRNLRAALDDFAAAVEAGRDAVGADFQFHIEIARATQNDHYAALMTSLGSSIIPRARLKGERAGAERKTYLRRVNGEHERILEAIAGRDAEAARAAMRTHLAKSCGRRRQAFAGARQRTAVSANQPNARKSRHRS